MSARTLTKLGAVTFCCRVAELGGLAKCLNRFFCGPSGLVREAQKRPNGRSLGLKFRGLCKGLDGLAGLLIVE